MIPRDQSSILQELLLQREVEDFLYLEYELLDRREYTKWLDLFDEEARYWAPLARNFKFGRSVDEFTTEQNDAAWFDDDKTTLSQRIRQILGGDHWAEEPASRTTHMLSNVRIESWDTERVTVNSRFVVHANRNEREEQVFFGRRQDVLVRTQESLRILKRSIFLDQHILLAKSITTFF